MRNVAWLSEGAFLLCSLVKKDAGMLDAFGKGASDDIRAAKNELYSQMTWDPVTAQSLNAPPQITTPRPSPPPSPKLETVLSGISDSNSAGVWQGGPGSITSGKFMSHAANSRGHVIAHSLNAPRQIQTPQPSPLPAPELEPVLSDSSASAGAGFWLYLGFSLTSLKPSITSTAT